MGGRIRTVVPPAAVPQALEQGSGMASQEVEVGAEGLLEQP